MASHQPRKRFGQNFLKSDAVIDRIVASIAPARDDDVIEIGPGLGALTGPLLERLDQLQVIELDRDLAAHLHDRLGQPAHLVIHQADALRVDYADYARSMGAESGLRIVGNLPYNISTPLLFHLLDFTDCVRDMHVMLQKEVVDRLTAPPGHKTYGRLSVMAQFRAACTALFVVPPEAFDPAPKVDSAVIRMVPRPLSPEASALLPALDAVVRQAFSQRRKTLRNTLKGTVESDRMIELGIEPGRRAETLSLDEFIALARTVLPNIDSMASR
ncbi:MAG: 16S rRNA (adenine(1518)-N(6)/adenine(1519)-N(6))-dimethyltransferase RsmA [Pseudomonadota bacterium]